VARGSAEAWKRVGDEALCQHWRTDGSGLSIVVIREHSQTWFTLMKGAGIEVGR